MGFSASLDPLCREYLHMSHHMNYRNNNGVFPAAANITRDHVVNAAEEFHTHNAHPPTHIVIYHSTNLLPPDQSDRKLKYVESIQRGVQTNAAQRGRAIPLVTFVIVSPRVTERFFDISQTCATMPPMLNKNLENILGI